MQHLTVPGAPRATCPPFGVHDLAHAVLPRPHRCVDPEPELAHVSQMPSSGPSCLLAAAQILFTWPHLPSPIHQPRAWGARFHGDFLPAPRGGFSGNEATVISSMWYELGGAEQSASLLSNPTPSPGAGNLYLSGLAGRQAGGPTCTSAHVSFSSSICPMLCLPGFQHSHSTTLQREPGSKLIQKWREL